LISSEFYKLNKKAQRDSLHNFQNVKELKQENNILNETVQLQDTLHQKTNRNLYFIIGFLTVLTTIILSSVILGFEDQTPSTFSSSFLIQNLRGDTIDTWISWKIVEGDPFHIHVVDSPYATEKRLSAIMDVIMSTEEIEIADSLLHKGSSGKSSTYYTGWSGALNSIDGVTESSIPKNLHSHVNDNGEGHIMIKLSNLSNADGYSGYTTSIVDQEQHQILKSTITIFNIESLSTEELKTILRHELGHGFGLAHSTAPEDLMYPVIATNYPYISECDLDAITLLYDGGQQSLVICKT
jgi:hypothetical protein